jgi:hypothetical protein
VSSNTDYSELVSAVPFPSLDGVHLNESDMKYYWNYRIMRHEDKLPTTLAKAIGKKTSVWFGLHEVHHMGKKIGWTQESMIGAFESKKEMIASLELMLKDAKKKRPILKYKD